MVLNSFSIAITGSQHSGRQSNLSNQSNELFNQAAMRSFIKRIWSWVTRKPDHLLSLSELSSQGELRPAAYVGSRPVDITKIYGSEDRTHDFDRDFNPVSQYIRERWTRIARLFLKGETLPPVELIELGDGYFVRDGHHRVSVARALGMRYIDAEIIRFHFRPFA
jgi:hypothetical protein